MKRIGTWWLAGALLLTSCVDAGSLHRLEGEPVGVQELLGAWCTPDGGGCVYIEPDRILVLDTAFQGDRIYRMDFVRIEGDTWANLRPREQAGHLPLWRQFWLSLRGDSLRVTFLDPSALHNRLEQHPGTTPFHLAVATEYHKVVLLTGNPGQLRKFYRKHSRDTTLFEQGWLVRVTTSHSINTAVTADSGSPAGDITP